MGALGLLLGLTLWTALVSVVNYVVFVPHPHVDGARRATPPRMPPPAPVAVEADAVVASASMAAAVPSLNERLFREWETEAAARAREPRGVRQPWNSAPETEDDVELDRVMRQAAQLAPARFPNAVVILLSNSGFHELLLNFLHFAHRTNPPVLNYVVFPLDEPEFRNVSLMNVTMFYPKSGNFFSPRARNFRSDAYNAIVMHKWVLAERALSLGFEPFVVDVDNLLLKNPFTFLQDWVRCDAAATTDSQSRKVLEETESRYEAQGHRIYINTGFIFWRNTPTALDMVRNVIAQRRHTDDQDIFCGILDELVKRREEQGGVNVLNVPVMSRHLQCADVGGFSFTMLPPTVFGSQRNMFDLSLYPERIMFAPYVIHFGYLAGFYEKRRFMNSTGFWNLTLP